MLSLVSKSDAPPECVLAPLPASEDLSSERLKENDFHEVYVAPSNVAKCLVVEASKYLREGFWKRGPEWSWGVPGSIIIHSSLGTIHDDVIPSDKSLSSLLERLLYRLYSFRRASSDRWQSQIQMMVQLT